MEAADDGKEWNATKLPLSEFNGNNFTIPQSHNVGIYLFIINTCVISIGIYNHLNRLMDMNAQVSIRLYYLIVQCSDAVPFIDWSS